MKGSKKGSNAYVRERYPDRALRELRQNGYHVHILQSSLKKTSRGVVEEEPEEEEEIDEVLEISADDDDIVAFDETSNANKENNRRMPEVINLSSDEDETLFRDVSDFCEFNMVVKKRRRVISDDESETY